MGAGPITAKSLCLANERYATILTTMYLVTDSHHLTEGGLTEAQVRLQLRKDEVDEIKEGKATMHDTSATGFLVTGLHIEALQ
jgi:hypothetical protein